jgi:hypothetical protein
LSFVSREGSAENSFENGVVCESKGVAHEGMIDWQILTITELHPGFGVEIEAVHKHAVVVKNG